MVCEAERGQKELVNLLDRSVRDMTSRVAGVNLIRSDASRMSTRDSGALVVKTTGDYRAVMVLSADNSFFEEVTRRMKRQEDVSLGDIVIYATEYYNILCGFFISHLNKHGHFKARFGIPEFISGYYPKYGYGEARSVNLCYNCYCGTVHICVTGLPEL